MGKPILQFRFSVTPYKHHDSWLLPFLLEIGYLERSPYKYSSAYGICYYYRINGEQFIADKPKPQPAPSRYAPTSGNTRR